MPKSCADQALSKPRRQKPIIVIDAANSTLKILEESGGNLKAKIAPSIGPDGQTWETWDKSATFNAAIAPYKKTHKVVGTYAVKSHGVGQQFMESVVILDQRSKIDGLESSKALIDLGGGTIFSAVVKPDGSCVQADFSDASGGVLILLQEIAVLPEFIATVSIKSKSLSRLSATQLGFLLGCLGGDSVFLDDGTLDYKKGTIQIAKFRQLWGSMLTERLNKKIVATVGKIQRFSLNAGHEDPIKESEVYLVGGGASLLDALACQSTGDGGMGISRYRGIVPAHYLNCYAAYLAAGGVYAW